jgi:hypothetical protein
MGAIRGWNIVAHGVVGQSTSHQNIGSTITVFMAIFNSRRENYISKYYL